MTKTILHSFLRHGVYATKLQQIESLRQIRRNLYRRNIAIKLPKCLQEMVKVKVV